MTIKLSNRQLAMLEGLAAVDHMTIDEAQAWDQRAFKSMLQREYAAYVPRRGFVLTPTGKNARQDFYSVDILRKDNTRPLTSYFDPSAYGLAPRKKRESKTKKEPGKNNVREFLKTTQGAA